MDKHLVATTVQSAGVGVPVRKEQREVHRLAESCYLTYSGISGHTVVVGEGTSLDFSGEGFGIEGSRAVLPGSLLTLCLCLPDGEEPLIVEEVRVAWVNGKRFGVQALAVGHLERKRIAQYVSKYHVRANKHAMASLDFVLPAEPVTT